MHRTNDEIDFTLEMKTRFFLIILFLSAMLACKQKDTFEEESLFGRWNIMKALRNGNETPYLRGGYLVLERDGKIIVNINGNEEKST